MPIIDNYMGIFDQLFRKKPEGERKQKKELPWIPLTSRQQLEALRSASAEKTQFIYKHSTTCGISGMVLRMLEGSVDLTDEEADFYFLDLHRYRDISNTVAAEFGVRHESPQLLVIKKGEVAAWASHGSIGEMDYSQYV